MLYICPRRALKLSGLKQLRHLLKSGDLENMGASYGPWTARSFLSGHVDKTPLIATPKP